MSRLIKNYKRIIIPAIIVFCLLVVSIVVFQSQQPNQDNFKAPGRDWESSKKVEDYFVEKLRMSPAEASQIRTKPGVDGTIDLRLSNNVTLYGLIGNLYYYGFIRDEEAFRYALEHTSDITSNEESIKVGKTGTIDTNAEYRISENMTAWELADTLLNKPAGHFDYDEYGYFFMP